MCCRYLLALALSAGVSSVGAAQFTTYIPPRVKLTDSAKAVVVAKEKARGDSIERVRLTEMKAWVDSAAGSPAVPAPAMSPAEPQVKPPAKPPTSPSSKAPVKPPVKPPTSQPVPTKPPPVTMTSRNESAPTLLSGARAPETASDLPLLALIGATTLGVGTVMLAGTKLGWDGA